MTPKFKIDEKFLVSVSKQSTITIISDNDNRLKSLDGATYWSVEDHQEFTKLRDELETRGFIKTNRSCWNMDVVTTPFILNGVKFHRGSYFPSACAIGIVLARSHKGKMK